MDRKVVKLVLLLSLTGMINSSYAVDFTEQQPFSSQDTNGPSDSYAIDLDGDGDADVLSASTSDDKIAWYENRLNEATGDFGPQQIISTAADLAQSIFAIDLDGDGDADVLSASFADDKIAWYENQLNETAANFSAQRIIDDMADGAKDVYAADLDDDGDADVVSAAFNGDQVVWYENRLGQTEADFSSPRIITSATNGAEKIFIADLDDDGDDDVISASFIDDKVAWYENRLDQSTADFGPQRIISGSVVDAVSIYAVDIDSDGDIDVLSASEGNQTVYLHENRLNQAEADFATQQTIAAPGGVAFLESIYASDLDDDGDFDLITATDVDRRVSWYENRLNQTEEDFGPQQVITDIASGSSSVFAIDLDGDNVADVISTSMNDDKVSWYKNRLSESENDFETLFVNSPFTTPGASSISSSDLDNDGDLDVISTSDQDDKVAWYENRLNEADADFAPQTIISLLDNGARSAFAIDLDGDGDNDVMAAAFLNDKISWYENQLNQAEANFSTQNIITEAADGAISAFAIDLDGDGDADVLSASSEDDKIAWYENRLQEAEADFGDQQIISSSANGAQSVFSIDFDGDGDADVLSASRQDNKIAWYENRLNQAENGFSSPLVINGSATSATFAYAADLDGDSDADVVIAYQNTVAWHENRLSQTEADFAPVAIISTDASAVSSLFTEDIDGDGDFDVLSASIADDKIAWYENRLNSSAADFGPQQIISVEADAALNVHAADLDGDGDIDVLSASFFDDKATWYNNGLQRDFGDAPDPLFFTLLENNGARHRITALHLGSAIDAESDGQPNAPATGDDSDVATNDEDGASFSNLLAGSSEAELNVTVSQAGVGRLNAFIDFNQNGSFSDDGEQVVEDKLIEQTSESITFSIPESALAGDTYARIRLSSVGGDGPFGQAADGEVEDYQITVEVEQVIPLPPPAVNLLLTGSPATENDGVATVTATISRAHDQPITIGLAFTGTAATSDYEASASQIVIPTGSVSGNITLTSQDDDVFEGDETVQVAITSVANGSAGDNNQVTATITDDDDAPAVTVTVNTAELAENGGTALVSALLNTASETETTVNLTFTGEATINSDYTVSSNQIVIPAGATSGRITITASNDSELEVDETVQISLSDISNGSAGEPSTAVVTIRDDEAQPIVNITTSNTQLSEGGSQISIIATLSESSPVPVTVQLTFGGGAERGSDYQVGSTQIIVASGATSGSVDLTAIDDSEDEPSELFLARIQSAQNATIGSNQSVEVSIVDNDDPAAGQAPRDSSEPLDDRTVTSNVQRIAIMAFGLRNNSSATTEVNQVNAILQPIEGRLPAMIQADLFIDRDNNQQLGETDVLLASLQPVPSDGITTFDLDTPLTLAPSQTRRFLMVIDLNNGDVQ